MIFQEQDIQFEKLNDEQFEELCFDLLVSYGFHSLTWRQGGADSGRDIEARFTLTNPLIGSYNEKWFIECKLYTKGVPPEELNSKIAWADAEQPQHLLLLISSYASNSARHWLEKIALTKPYRIHLMEGKQLKALIASIPRIVTKYFIDPVSKLFMEAQANWQNHNIFPNPETFWIFYQELEDAKLSNRDLAFLWCALHLRYDEISEWAENEDVVFPSEYLASILKARADHDRSILRELEGSIKAPNVSTFQHIEPRKNYRWLRAELKYFNTKETCKALYCFIGDSKGEGFEVFYTYDDPTYIRHVSSQANQEISGAEQLL